MTQEQLASYALQNPLTNSSDSFTRFRRNDGPSQRSWLLRAVKDADWAGFRQSAVWGS